MYLCIYSFINKFIFYLFFYFIYLFLHYLFMLEIVWYFLPVGDFFLEFLCYYNT